tara:strand:+ start:85 stop:405 length:321 start_codon:yes stop_codon:yes gene_type:complete
MAITASWEVNTLDRDLSDGFVNKVIYRVKGLDGGTEKTRATGEVTFTKPKSLPSDFKAYDSLSESDCLTWVKNTLGSDEVTAIETSLTNEINLINSPTTGTGKPWS